MIMPNYKRIFVDNTYVFLTVLTYKRRPILIENIALLRESFQRAKEIYDFQIFGSVILPDHMHLIIFPNNIKNYPKIIFAIKYHFSKNTCSNKQDLTQSKIKKGEKGIWHRRYYEHTIRNEESLYQHLEYIHYNPVKHGYAKNVKDWEYSSFHKFVKQNYYDISWGTFEDTETLQGLDFE
jgi:putative transposase